MAGDQPIQRPAAVAGVGDGAGERFGAVEVTGAGDRDGQPMQRPTAVAGVGEGARER